MSTQTEEPPSGWLPDPTRRHEGRYFAAGHPTDLVRDGGIESIDPEGEQVLGHHIDVPPYPVPPPTPPISKSRGGWLVAEAAQRGSAARQTAALPPKSELTPLPGWPPATKPYYRSTLVVAIAASVGIMVGSVGPWAGVLMFTVNGLDAGNWGVTALTIGAVSCVVLLTVLFWLRTYFSPRWAVSLAWAAAVAGIACLTFALPTLIRILTIPREHFFGIPIGAEVGWGLWLLAFSSAVLCVTASIVATQIAQYVDLLQPQDQSQTSWTDGWRWASIIASTAIVISGFIYFSTHWETDSGPDRTLPTELSSFPSSPSFTGSPSLPRFPSLPNPSNPSTTSEPPETSTPIPPSKLPQPATTTTAVPLDPQSASVDQLKATASADRPFVTSWLTDRWVAQLSSKRPGLVADGIRWDTATILREHLQLRHQYPAVRLLWSGDWSTFSAPNFWVTIAGIGFSNPDSALAWCTNQNLDRDHCYAKLVSTTHSIDGSTAYN